MNPQKFNDKYVSLVEDCLDELFEVIKTNEVGRIDFTKEFIIPAYATFYTQDNQEINKEVQCIEVDEYEGVFEIKVISNNECGYVDEYSTNNITNESLFDIYRAICDAVETGKYQKRIIYK